MFVSIGLSQSDLLLKCKAYMSASRYAEQWRCRLLESGKVMGMIQDTSPFFASFKCIISAVFSLCKSEEYVLPQPNVF